MSDAAYARMTAACKRQLDAVADCHRKYKREPERSMVCKHLSSAAALCLVESICPVEAERARSECASAGTSVKARRCKRAKAALQECVMLHQ